jgi:DNA modification methylase
VGGILDYLAPIIGQDICKAPSENLRRDMKINLDSISIPAPSVLTPEGDREVKELADSIKEQGMSHPIIVRQTNKGGNGFILVSGEKRVLAHKVLGVSEIEAEVRNVDEVGGKILRLHENIKRTNLPWWETALLVEELHKLRQSQHGGKTEDKPGPPTKEQGKVWGIRETAEELGRALGPLSEDLQLARAVKINPSLRNIRDRKTAVRLVRQEARRRDAEIEASRPTEEAVDQAFLGDAATVLSHFSDKTFDHCITDPPWLKFYEPGMTYDNRTLPVFKEIYRVLKYNSFLLVFCGLDDYHYYCGTDLPGENGNLKHTGGALEKIGFTVSKTPAIWRKESALSRRGVRSWEYDRDFEFVIVAVKGSPTMVHPTAVSAIKSYPIVPIRNIIHPNEKPVEVIMSFLEDISYAKNIILDPFGGSFVTAEACQKLDRRWIVVERDPDVYKKGCKRIGVTE